MCQADKVEAGQHGTTGTYRWYGLNSNHFLQQRMQAHFLGICIFVDKSVFNACYGYEDGWFNVNFSFEGLKTNLDSDKDKIKIVVDFPSLYHADLQKKDRKQATKVFEIKFGFYLERKLCE